MPVKNPPKTVQEAVERYMMTALRAAERRVRAGEFNPAEFNVLMSAARPVLAALNKRDEDGTGSNIDELRRALQDANTGGNTRRTRLGRTYKGTVPGDPDAHSRPADPPGGAGGPHEERRDAGPDGFANTSPIADSERALSALARPARSDGLDVVGAQQPGGDDTPNDPRSAD